MQHSAACSGDFQASGAALMAQYAALCRYCDQAFAAALGRYPDHMQCANGCASCCILETVAPLEAAVIAAHLAAAGPPVMPARAAHQCVFLDRAASCAVYPVRPIICRTHGMPLQYPEMETLDICPLNFSDQHPLDIEPQYALDAERIAANLLRLNLAFCMLMGSREAAGERIPLADLLAPSQHRFPILSRFLESGLAREK